MVEHSTEPLDRVFGALADPTRRALIERLAAGGATIGELAAPFAMSFQAISKHVGVLERAGLVSRAVRGRTHHLALDAAALSRASVWIERYRLFWDRRLDELAAYIEPPENQP